MARNQSAASKRLLTQTGGVWDRAERPVYFTASDNTAHNSAGGLHKHILIAINAIRSTDDLVEIEKFVDQRGCVVLIDSGVFELATRHAASHDMTMAEALSLAPSELSGFEALFSSYVKYVTRLQGKSWGYIEIDQGGQINKIKTRDKLEGMGLRPIPVYHPFNDGWDYFDYLAERYDRICIGNLVQADPATRKRLIATAWERRRKYPHLWIHALGVTPSDLTAAYPLDSCDSSTWMSGIRWGTHDAKIANKRAWPLGVGFSYDREADVHSPSGHRQAMRLAGYDAGMVSRTMKIMVDEQRRAIGTDDRMVI